MPEMIFTVRWPDGSVDQCYSPTLAMHDHLDPGVSYAVDDFVSRSVEALELAAERVRASHGYACTAARSSSELIRSKASAFDVRERVRVLTMRDARPPEPGEHLRPTA